MDRFEDLKLDKLLGKQTQSPTGSTRRSCGASQRDQTGFRFAIKLAWFRSLGQTPLQGISQTVADKPLTNSLNSANAERKTFGNRLILPSRSPLCAIGFKKNLRMLQLAGCNFPLAGEGQQFTAFCRG